jgi:T5orf172 domain
VTCTARWATGDGAHRAGDLCGAPATERVGDSDLCPYHFGRALDWFYKRRIELPAERQREHEESLRQAAEARRLAAEARSIVYYLHRPADGLIKIGTSTDHRTRFRDLRREHGHLRLLLAYAGGHKEETEAHNRFAGLWVRGEWFRPELSLLLEIQRIRRARDRQASQLPEQVPTTEIRALVRAARGRPLTATLTATRRVDLSGQERSGGTKVAGQEGVST